MTKAEFLARLQSGLVGLPPGEVEDRLAFYGELIDDRMEEGLSQAEAVRAVGSVEQIVAQILAEAAPEAPLPTVPAGRPSGASRAQKIVFWLCAPVWFPLLLAAGIVLLSLWIVLWALVASLWIVEGSFWVAAVGGVGSLIVFGARGYVLTGLAFLAAGICCAGLSVFLFFGCRAATKGALWLTKRSVSWGKRGKKEAQL